MYNDTSFSYSWTCVFLRILAFFVFKKTCAPKVFFVQFLQCIQGQEQTKIRSGQENYWFFFLESYTACPINTSYPIMKYQKIYFIEHNSEWMGVHTKFCGAVNNHTEIIIYNIWSRLGTYMFSAPHSSTVGSLNRLNRLLLITDKANKCDSY